MELASLETCNLSEVMLNNHDSFYDFKRSIKFAYLYSKTITLLSPFIKDEEQRDIMLSNRRIGLGLTGIAQFVEREGITKTREFLQKGYNEVSRYDDSYSDWFGINHSIRTTTVKPSGSISLLSGSTPGMHYAISPYYIRRIRLNEDSPILNVLIKAGYTIEDDAYADFTKVVSIPVNSGVSRHESELSIWEQLELAALLQECWSDNSVSVTVKFDKLFLPKQDMNQALRFYQHRLKAVSFLPNINEGEYAQPPYQPITEFEYNLMLNQLKPLDFENMTDSHDTDDMYCNNDVCEIK